MDFECSCNIDIGFREQGCTKSLLSRAVDGMRAL